MLFIFSCIVFLGTGLWVSAHIFNPFSNKLQGNSLHVTNKTNALHVTSIEKTEGQYPDVKITLINNSSKNITAYILSIRDLTITTDFALLGGFLAPGQTKVEIIPYSNFEARATGEVEVSAIYFDDQTGEGEARPTAMIREKHQGAKEQLNRILPILLNSLNSSQADTEALLAALESQASQLPTKIDNVSLSADHRSGLDYIKQTLDLNIKSLKNSHKSTPNFDRKAELRKLITFYQRILTKL